ncbi:50S ribosomal protein L25 [Deltaproteobacteria bacterium]|nr:50S ribosomal protein L25 [Deltaproteobacteria bacterium]
MGLSTVLKAAPREARGGNQVGRLRREERLPAVFYGPGQDQALSLSLDYKEFKTALTTSEGNRSLYTLAIEGQPPQAVLLKDYQVDPLSRRVIHADFYRLDPARPVTVKVPVVLTGKPAGVEKGGQLQPGLREVAVSARPDQAPAELLVDVTALSLGQSLHLSQVTAPDETRLVFTTDLPVATVTTPKGLKAEAETVAAPVVVAPVAAATGAKKAAATAVRGKGKR